METRSHLRTRTVLPISLLIACLTGCSANREEMSLPPQSLDEAARRNFGDEGTELAPAEESEMEQQLAEEESTWLASGEPEATDQSAEAEPQVQEAPFAAGSPAAPPAATVPAEEGEEDSTLVVIGDRKEGDESENPLLQASLKERRRRQTAPPAVAVITDKNLAEFADGGRLTYVDKPPPQQLVSGDGQTSTAEEEIYWRNRVRGLRTEWKRNHELIDELQAKANDLRRRFYAEDDPYVRDRRIKPEWDRTLDRLEEARRGEERAREELEIALEEGRRAGAMPGWLRDGKDLEPRPEPEEEVETHDPEEPQVIDP